MTLKKGEKTNLARTPSTTFTSRRAARSRSPEGQLGLERLSKRNLPPELELSCLLETMKRRTLVMATLRCLSWKLVDPTEQHQRAITPVLKQSLPTTSVLPKTRIGWL